MASIATSFWMVKLPSPDVSRRHCRVCAPTAEVHLACQERLGRFAWGGNEHDPQALPYGDVLSTGSFLLTQSCLVRLPLYFLSRMKSKLTALSCALRTRSALALRSRNFCPELPRYGWRSTRSAQRCRSSGSPATSLVVCGLFDRLQVSRLRCATSSRTRCADQWSAVSFPPCFGLVRCS